MEQGRSGVAEASKGSYFSFVPEIAYDYANV